MKLTSEKIEEVCIPMLQHEVRFTCKGKTLRQGKLLLMSQKAHYICFTVTNNNDIPKSYELPYPFDYYFDENFHRVVFDYTIRKLCNDNNYSMELLRDLPEQKNHRLYNSILYVEKI